jgi:hypothetical protein
LSVVAQKISLDELRKKAHPIMSRNPDIETDARMLCDLVLNEVYNDEVIAYLVEAKTDDIKKVIGDIIRFRNEAFHSTPPKIQPVKYTVTRNKRGEHRRGGMETSEAYNDSAARARIAKMLGLESVPQEDPGAMDRIKGKIQLESGEFFDGVEEIRSVRETWADYR